MTQNFSSLKSHAGRLKTWRRFEKELELFVNHNNIKAAIILNCVESLLETNIRYDNQPNGKTLTGYFKILSISGMVIINGFHLHIAIAYKKAKQLVIINKWKHFIN